MKDILQIKSVRGGRVEFDDTAVTPISKALVLRLPFGGFVWNRPVGIEVEKDQNIERIPIIDVTLMVQLGLVAFGTIITIIYWLIGRKKINKGIKQ
ncbi:MAG: hypothetical protein PVH03_03650 [Chloroflexota bacterium]